MRYESWAAIERGEGRGRQTRSVVEIRGGEARPGVADILWVGDGGAGGNDGFAAGFDFGLGAEEDAVGACHFEAFGRTSGVEAGGVVEPDMHGAAFGVGEAEEGAGGGDVLFVDDAAGEEGEALADGLLVGGMDVVLVADVDGDGHAGVGEGEGVALGIAERPSSHWCCWCRRRSGRRGREVALCQCRRQSSMRAGKSWS